MDEFVKLVRRQRDAFTRKDVSALTADLADDYAWFRITEDGSAIKSASGKAEVAERMGTFFKTVPYTGSRVERAMTVGNYIVAEEQDTFDTPQGPRTQITLGVYEIKDGKFRRAWAFPVKT
ncbi:MAG: nuclear transport factor 2 family protein [Rhodospirillaceae bacterium]|nr:nuclear transport factor 2 family protein [Rhodospirillaceae bacterium]